mgnify:CR=1 FL=1
MPKKSKRRVKSKKVKKEKVVKIEHKHYIYKAVAKSNLFTILKKDNLDEFIKVYGNKFNIQKSTGIGFSCRDKTCKELAGLECIVSYNQGKIAKHLINNNKINVHTMLMLIKLMTHEKQRLQSKKLFIDCMLYLDLPENEISTILNKLIILGDWDLIDLFHKFGFRSIDINEVTKYIPKNKLDQICDLGYNFSNDGLLTLLGNINEIKVLKKLNITKELITAKSNRNAILSIYKNATLNIIQYIENAFGFVKNNDCLTYAIKGLNFPVIWHLLDSGVELQKDQLLMLLNLKIMI